MEQKGPLHLAESFYTNKVSAHLLPLLGKTNITPNMVTGMNAILMPFTLYYAYKKEFIIVAIMMQVYEFLDNLDGNLARYKKLSSKFGAKLDQICDFIFYNCIFIFLGINLIQWYIIFLLVLLINLYGFIATYYIVPRLRKLKIIKRRGLKKYFMDKGIILGIDVGTMDVIVTIFLLLGLVRELYFLLISLFVLDIIYRILELKYNEKLIKNN